MRLSTTFASCQTCSFDKNCAMGIEPNYTNLKKNLDNSLMLVTALNTKIGYYKAAEIFENHNSVEFLIQEIERLDKDE